MIWRTGRFTHDLTSHALIMGILNVTPDSFSDGGNFLDADRAVDRAFAMLAEGAAIIDVGGESTRPGAPSVSAELESRRVLPVIERIMRAVPDCVLSIDTSKAAVAQAAIDAGASIVNDVTALRGDSAMAALVARTGVGVVLMHMQGDPRTMQLAPTYHDVVSEVSDFLVERRQVAIAAGIAPECIAFDPGIGFGKTGAHNVALLRHLKRFSGLQSPVLVGVSRKSFLAKLAASEILSDRLWPTVAITALAVQQGVRIVRVHDVRPNALALRVSELLRDEDHTVEGPVNTR